jgi:hypothetical protein
MCVHNFLIPLVFTFIVLFMHQKSQFAEIYYKYKAAHL